MLVLGCEPFFLPCVAARQIARAAGSERCAAKQLARAVSPTDRVARHVAPAAVAGLAALSAVAGLAALTAVAGLAALAAVRAAPPTQRKPTLTGSATSRFATSW